jgi:methylmalonyl-CoA/ethylmalonyl-CoA epimerase
MKVNKIHHINFLVKDLNEAMKRYTQLLGGDDFIVDDLPNRGVKTARTLMGEQWFVLIEPLDPQSIPGRHLSAHGEGFFLISFAVDDLTNAKQHVTNMGCKMTSDQPRQGLENWHVWDIDSSDTFGTQIQLCQEK